MLAITNACQTTVCEDAASVWSCNQVGYFLQAFKCKCDFMFGALLCEHKLWLVMSGFEEVFCVFPI